MMEEMRIVSNAMLGGGKMMAQSSGCCQNVARKIRTVCVTRVRART